MVEECMIGIQIEGEPDFIDRAMLQFMNELKAAGNKITIGHLVAGSRMTRFPNGEKEAA